MTATLIKEIEGAPTNLLAWPGAWAPADNLDAERAAWARIEAYTAVRYTSRTIVWVVEGPGDWEPPLRPATITTTERWTGSAFETSPLIRRHAVGTHCLAKALTVSAGLSVLELHRSL
jgi:hypothetical protein